MPMVPETYNVICFFWAALEILHRPPYLPDSKGKMHQAYVRAVHEDAIRYLVDR